MVEAKLVGVEDEALRGAVAAVGPVSRSLSGVSAARALRRRPVLECHSA